MEKRKYGLNSKISPISKIYTYLLLLTAFMGHNMISFPLPWFSLSLYRALLLLSPLMLLGIGFVEKKELRKNVNFPYLVFLWIWLLYVGVSGWWVMDFSAWMINTLFLATGVVVSTFIFGFLYKEEDFVYAFSVLEFMGLVMAVWGLYESITGNYLFASSEYAENYRYSSKFSLFGQCLPVVSLGNVNDYSAFLYFSAFASLILLQFRKNPAGKIFSLCCLVLIGVVIFLAGSRATILGTLIALWVFFLLKCRHSKNRKFNTWVYVLVGMLVVVSAFLIGGDWLRTRMLNAGSDSARIGLIKNGFYLLKDHLWLGVGWGNIEYFNFHHPQYISAGYVLNMHNWWMEILVSCGIFIFLVYMFFYLRNYWMLVSPAWFQRLHLSRISKKRHWKNTRNILVAFFTGLIVVAMTSSSFVRADWWWAVFSLYMAFSGWALQRQNA